MAVACSRVMLRTCVPLIAMARWKSPLAAGMPKSVLTLLPPPDCPNTVTLFGSPPKFEMLSRIHSSAATMSSMPALPSA